MLPVDPFFILAIPHGLWGHSSPSRDWAQALGSESWTPDHWTAREFPADRVLDALTTVSNSETVLENVLFFFPPSILWRPILIELYSEGIYILTFKHWFQTYIMWLLYKHLAFLVYLSLFFFPLWVMPCDFLDLSSPTKDQTQAHISESTKS